MFADVDWKKLERGQFERLVEALLHREHSRPGVRVYVPDGRGGDKGRDVYVEDEATGATIQIFQLKHYPEGFSGKQSRRRSITESFETAMQHRPLEWTLVTPGNITDGERRTVGALKKQHSVIVRTFGRVELDLMLAKHPDLQRWAMREPIKEAFERIGRGTEALLDLDSIAAGAVRLQQAGNAMSPYWTQKLTITDDEHLIEFEPRHPDAAEIEPLVWEASLDLSQAPELREALERIIDWGADESITIPPSVVQHLERLGPDWFAGKDTNVAIDLSRPERTLSEPITVGLHDDREVFSSHDARLVYLQSGKLGGTIGIELAGGVSMQWTVPRDTAAEVTASFAFEPVGLTARAARRGTRFFAELQRADAITLHLPLAPLTINLPPGGTLAIGEPVTQCIDDLAVIEAACDVDFSVPQEIPKGVERIWIRVARQLMDGLHVAVPANGRATMTLEGERDPALEALLAAPHAVRQTARNHVMEVLGKQVPIGRVHSFNILEVEDGPAILDELIAGRAAGRVITLNPVDGRAFTYVRAQDADALPPVTPWGLIGFREHPGLPISPGTES